MLHFKGEYGGFVTEAVIRDKGEKQFLYEIKFIEKEKVPNRVRQINLPARLQMEMLRTFKL